MAPSPRSEEFDVISASDLELCHDLGIRFTATMPRPFKSFRHWLKCPFCGRRYFNLYRLDPSSGFHNLPASVEDTMIEDLFDLIGGRQTIKGSHGTLL